MPSKEELQMLQALPLELKVMKTQHTYTEDGKKVVEDTKSEATKTPLYRLKKRLLAERYGIKIKEVTREQI